VLQTGSWGASGVLHRSESSVAGRYPLLVEGLELQARTAAKINGAKH